MTEAQRQKERARLLRHLAKHSFTLEWPCDNPVLHELVETGAAVLGEHSTAHWNGRDHNMRRISITDLGRNALAEAPSGS